MKQLHIKTCNEYIDFVNSKHGFNVNGTRDFGQCCIELKKDEAIKLCNDWFAYRFGSTYEDVAEDIDRLVAGNDIIINCESDYYHADYISDFEALNRFNEDKKLRKRTRRQFSYMFEEKNCMQLVQFIDRTAIIYFRSCDAVKKFMTDLTLIIKMCEIADFDCDNIICIFGSLHRYDGDRA